MEEDQLLNAFVLIKLHVSCTAPAHFWIKSTALNNTCASSQLQSAYGE